MAAGFKEQLASIGIDRNLDQAKELGGAVGIAKRVGSDVKAGLPDASVANNRETYGPNRLPPKKTRGFWDHLVEALGDDTLKILMFSAACSMAFGFALSDNKADIIQGFAILLAVVVVSGINSFQNWSKDREFRSLAEFKADRNVMVVRGGVEKSVSVYDLVVGDLVLVPAGDMIPADGLMVAGYDVEVDQSSLTGESEQVVKEATGDCLMLSSAKVGNGDAIRMLVTAVGSQTQIGKAFTTIQEEEDKETPLQERLSELADQIGQVGTAAGALTFFVLAGLWLWHNPHGNDAAAYWTLLRTDFTALIRFFIVGVTIVVVAVPEGLPLAVTISLAFSMRRMMEDNNMVRELQACETMGSATVIASDKTGTLTANRMSVTEAYVYAEHIAGVDKGRLAAHIGSPGALVRLAKAVALNSSARLRTGKGGRVAFEGSPTEGALLHMLAENGVEYQHLRDEAGEPLARRAFRKELKYQTTVVGAEDSKHAEGPIVYVTGAPEVVFEKCTSIMHKDGQSIAMTPELLFNLREEQSAISQRGLRMIAVAYRRIDKKTQSTNGSNWRAALDGGELETGLSLIGMFGLQDPLREGVPEAVAQCQAAGIRVMMVTGDSKDTATAIARGCGILKAGDSSAITTAAPAKGKAGAAKALAIDWTTRKVMEGSEFRGLSVEGKQEAARHLAVLARCSPADKHELVTALRATGEVVAVTGDGTNDAPALKAADVGLSMGIAGTEVAKEASHIVILDDNFASIVATVRWGRSIKENIRKFLNFQLTINIVALTLTIITACLNKGSTEAFPIKPVQLLWINLIMDSFAALMLATEPPSEKLMRYAPQGKEEALITRTMMKNMVGHAVFQTILLLWLTMSESGSAFFSLNYDTADDHTDILLQRKEDTIVFTTFVALQIFNLFNCRSVHDEWNIMEDFSGSVIAQVILVIIVIMQVVIVQFGGDIMQTAPLSLDEWRKCVLLGALSIPVGYLLKIIPVVDTELRHIGVPTSSEVPEAFAKAAAAAAGPDNLLAGAATPLPSSEGEDGPGAAAAPAGSLRRRASRKE